MQHSHNISTVGSPSRTGAEKLWFRRALLPIGVATLLNLVACANQSGSLSLQGKPLSGVEAVEAGLINQAVPFAELEEQVRERAGQLASIPLSQLTAMKLIVNQAYENMGLASTQLLGPILDGLMRNTPEAKTFIELASSEGVGAAVRRRDGVFGDYSQAPSSEQPDPGNVIVPEQRRD